MHRNTKLLALSLGIIPIGIVLLGGTPVSAYNQPSATVNVPDSVSSGTLEPNVNHPYAISKFYTPVTIDVTDVSQYQVYISAVGDVDLRGKTNTDNILHSVTSTTGIPIASMDNEWGYYAAWSDNDNHAEDHLYARVPDSTTATEFDTRTPHGSETRTLNLNFAAKVNGEQPADTYTGTIEVSVVYTPEWTTLFDITYMQDMDHSVCSLTHTPSSTATAAVTTKDEADTLLSQSADGSTISKVPTVSLIDKRDNKVYKVAKLADDNCWMVQNLALAGGTEISSADSDIAVDSIPATSSNVNKKDTFKLPESNPTPFGGKVGVSGSDGQAMYNGKHIDDSYDTVGFISESYCDRYYYADAVCNGTNSGAYYSWQTATAASLPNGPIVDEPGTALNSLCPAGWGLPAATQLSELVSRGLYSSLHPNYTGYIISGGALIHSGNISNFWSKDTTGASLHVMVFQHNATEGNVSVTSFPIYFSSNIRCVAR